MTEKWVTAAFHGHLLLNTQELDLEGRLPLAVPAVDLRIPLCSSLRRLQQTGCELVRLRECHPHGRQQSERDLGPATRRRINVCAPQTGIRCVCSTHL